MEQAILPGMRKEVTRARVRKELKRYHEKMKNVLLLHKKMQEELKAAQGIIEYASKMMEELDDRTEVQTRH